MSHSRNSVLGKGRGTINIFREVVSFKPINNYQQIHVYAYQSVIMHLLKRRTLSPQLSRFESQCPLFLFPGQLCDVEFSEDNKRLRNVAKHWYQRYAQSPDSLLFVLDVAGTLRA